MTALATNVDTLRQGWEDAAAALAPDAETLNTLLETRLREAADSGRLDESSLLSVVDEARRVAGRTMPESEAAVLARRMQQVVYEYLLSLDAVVEPRLEPEVAGAAEAATRAATLIGAEEVAELGLETVAAAVTAEPDAAAPQGEVPLEAGVAPEAAPDASLDAEAPEATVEAETAPGEDAAAEPEPAPEAPRRRFTIFRRSGSRDTLGAGEENGETPASDPGSPPPGAPETAAGPGSPDHPEAAYIAPKDGFRITEFDIPPVVVPSAVPPPAAAAPRPAAPSAGFASGAADLPLSEPDTSERGSGGRSWGILRRGKRGPEAEVPQRPAEPAADDPDAAETESRFTSDPAVLISRRQINERLRQRRCDEAASTLQRLATDVGGRDVADLALDAGDRCRALGKTNAALSCYLAASRADPVHETPLLRLADICLDDKDIDLAVTYLERVARLHRVRDDMAGAVRVYRKIATVAPYREDILNMLMHVQATGRFPDE